MKAFESGVQQFFQTIESEVQLTFTCSQIWALDSLGFHSIYSCNACDDEFREPARQACIHNQPQIGHNCCAYPFKLNEKLSGALVVGFKGQCSTRQSQQIEDFLQNALGRLDDLMSVERLARLSGSAQRADWLGKAISLAYELEHSSEPKVIYAKIHRALKQLMYAENFFVVKLDPSGKFLSFEYISDRFNANVADIPVREGVLQGSFSAYVVKTGRVIRGSTFELSKQTGLDAVSDYGEEANDWIGVPLVLGQEVFGAIVVQSYDPDICFSDRDPSVLALLAEALATSFARRKNTKELEEQVARRTCELNTSLAQLKTSMAELKSVQNQLVESQKQAALGHLVTGIAHELNTPLGVCTTANSLIAEKTKALTNKFDTNTMTKLDLALFIETLTNSTGLLSSNLGKASLLIERFKQVSAQQQSEQARWFNLKEHLDKMLNCFGHRHGGEGFLLQGVCCEDVEVHSYPNALTEVMEQLVENSIVHGFDGKNDGQIRIEVQQVDNSVVIDYQDNGVGIDETIAAKAFDPFVTTTRSNGSVGIGLHIIANTVTQTLKGTIRFCDKEGDGVQLTIRFPLDFEIAG